MPSEYHEIHTLLSKYKVEIAKQMRDCRAMQDPQFDPLLHVDLDFSRYDLTQDKVLEALVHHGREDEAAIQMEFVDSCLARLKVAMGVIESQMALARRPFDIKNVFTNKAIIERCILQDHYAVRTLYDQVEILRRYQQDKHLPIRVDEDSLMSDLANLTVQYKKLNDNKVSPSFHRQSKEVLMDELFKARLDYATITAEDIGFTLEKTNNALSEALYLKVAVDEGVFENNSSLNRLIGNSLAYADKRLKDASAMVITIENFLADIYEMGEGDYGREAFRINRYKPVTIKGLDQIAP